MPSGGTSPGGGGGGHRRTPLRRLIRLSRNAVPSNEGGRFHSPPYLSFDPAIEAERRAAQRGLTDIAQDTRIAGRRAAQDFRTTRRDLRIDLRRGLSDFRRDLNRGRQDIGFQRQDTRREARRGRQDFRLQLGAINRHFSQLAGQQVQQANLQGVLDSGTMSAAAVARARNKAIAQQPIKIGLQRLAQDTRTTMGRLGIQEQRLEKDIDVGRSRLRKDIKHDKRLAKQDYRRTIKDLHNKLARAIREQRIGDIDLIKEEIFAARRSRPGHFSKYGKKNKKSGD